jgi:hypothetical protein
MSAKRECVEAPLNTKIKKNDNLKNYVTNELGLKHTFHNCIWALVHFFEKFYKKKDDN